MLSISLLGPVEVARSDSPHRPLGSSVQRAALAALALRPGEVVSADRLMEVIWGDDLPATAATTLHAHVSRLRRAVGPDHIATVPPGYSLVDARSDVQFFEELIAEDGRLSLDKALKLWRGDPFGDLADREIFRSEAMRLVEMRASVEERLIELTLQVDPGRAVAEAEALVENEPLRERRWELLAQSLHRVGRTAEALRAVDRAAHELAQVGLEPSQRLRELETRIAVGEPPEPPTSVPRPPVRVAPPGGLIGRDIENRAVTRLLGDSRLVTLVGSGGVGKTHLARAVAGTVGEGSHWCDLASVEDKKGVVPAIARSVGAPVVGDIERSLVEWLSHRRLLLVFDNCEHLVGAVARLTSRLLEAAPGVRVLATSREPLRVAAEWVFRLAPLKPDTAAADLFVARARASGAPQGSLDRSVVLGICRLLDGLPLAIEMAAARSASLGVQELDRLLRQGVGILSDGRPARRSLDEVVAWSVGMLDESERRALEGAAVFAGEFDLSAAQAVLDGATGDASHVPAMLASLVERSLLEVHHRDNEVGYTMLYTIREVVSGSTDPVVRDQFIARHSHYFSTMAEGIGRDLIGPREIEAGEEALRWLAELRAAVFRAPASDEALTICEALYPLAYHRSRSDVAAWAEVVFPAVEGSGRPGIGAVGAMAAVGAIGRGELELAAELVRRARASSRSPHDLIRVLDIECDLSAYTGRLSDMESLGQDLTQLARQQGDITAELLASLNVALGRAYGGNPAGAIEVVERVRELEKESDSPTIAAWVDYLEGEVRLESDPKVAADLLNRAVETAHRVGARLVEGVAGLSAASVWARHGDVDVAHRHFDRIIRHWLEAGVWVHQWVTLRNLALLLERSGDDEGAAVLLAAVDGRERPTYGAEAERLAGLQARLVDRLGEEEFRARRLEAAGLSDRNVVDYALGRLQG